MSLLSRVTLSKTHRRLGMLATVPIAGWILSSFVLHGVGLALPNGLQGVYTLKKHHATPVGLEDEALLAPEDAARRAAADEGLGRLYWLRLDILAGRAVYVAKPGPFEEELVYDARSGERLDPLSDEDLLAIANAELEGSWAASVHPLAEFNRYYLADRIDAVAIDVEGSQPTELVISRSGRVLRRTDPLAEWFHKAYRSVHVWQWGESLRWFTAVLYGLVGVALTLVTLGYTLWWQRRHARRRWTPAVRLERRVHGRLAPLAGALLATQMLVGAYLWYNLGLIEPRFRGQGSFAAEWAGGLAAGEALARPSVIRAALPPSIVAPEARIQRYEWRAIGDERFWLAYPARDEEGVLVDASSAAVLPGLTIEQARIAGENVVAGRASGAPAEATEYWMDFNARVPTYRFRFADPDDSDVHVSRTSGEVVQRRPAIWRAFGPFLAYHTFGFTGNRWFDTVLLTALQVTVLVMVVSGWRLALRPAPAGERPDRNTNSGESHMIRSTYIAVLLAAVAVSARPAHAQSPDEGAVVAVVDAFHAALAAGDSTTALAQLAPDVAILETGGVETLTQYRTGHLTGDMRFAQAVPRERGEIRVTVLGDVAWAWSTNVATGRMGEREINSQGAELMVLARTAGAWKIRAVHWSSRARRTP